MNDSARFKKTSKCSSELFNDTRTLFKADPKKENQPLANRKLREKGSGEKVRKELNQTQQFPNRKPQQYQDLYRQKKSLETLLQEANNLNKSMLTELQRLKDDQQAKEQQLHSLNQRDRERVDRGFQRVRIREEDSDSKRNLQQKLLHYFRQIEEKDKVIKSLSKQLQSKSRCEDSSVRKHLKQLQDENLTLRELIQRLKEQNGVLGLESSRLFHESKDNFQKKGVMQVTIKGLKEQNVRIGQQYASKLQRIKRSLQQKNDKVIQLQEKLAEQELDRKDGRQRLLRPDFQQLRQDLDRQKLASLKTLNQLREKEKCIQKLELSLKQIQTQRLKSQAQFKRSQDENQRKLQLQSINLRSLSQTSEAIVRMNDDLRKQKERLLKLLKKQGKNILFVDQPQTREDSNSITIINRLKGQFQEIVQQIAPILQEVHHQTESIILPSAASDSHALLQKNSTLSLHLRHRQLLLEKNKIAIFKIANQVTLISQAQRQLRHLTPQLFNFHFQQLKKQILTKVSEQVQMQKSLRTTRQRLEMATQQIHFLEEQLRVNEQDCSLKRNISSNEKQYQILINQLQETLIKKNKIILQFQSRVKLMEGQINEMASQLYKKTRMLQVFDQDHKQLASHLAVYQETATSLSLLLFNEYIKDPHQIKKAVKQMQFQLENLKQQVQIERALKEQALQQIQAVNIAKQLKTDELLKKRMQLTSALETSVLPLKRQCSMEDSYLQLSESEFMNKVNREQSLIKNIEQQFKKCQILLNSRTVLHSNTLWTTEILAGKPYRRPTVPQDALFKCLYFGLVRAFWFTCSRQVQLIGRFRDLIEDEEQTGRDLIKSLDQCYSEYQFQQILDRHPGLDGFLAAKFKAFERQTALLTVAAVAERMRVASGGLEGELWLLEGEWRFTIRNEEGWVINDRQFKRE